MRFFNVFRKFCNARCLSSAFLLVVTVTTANSQTFPRVTDSKTETEQEQLVRAFVAAFNAHDTKRMLTMAHENIQWVSVNQEKTPVEAEGVKALQKSMDSYFSSCPSCKSTLEWVQSAGSRVTTLERAEWTGKNGLRSQKGLAVYEFKDGKILRVYYFPAEVTQK